MDLRNSFDALDPRNPGFIGLESESEIDSVPDYRRDEVHNDRRDAMEVDEGIDNGHADQQHAMDVVCPFSFFASHFDNCSLPGDIPAKGSFDHRLSFALGDPGVDYEGTQGCEYEVSGARGEPHWDRIFGYLLQHFGHIRLFQTAFVLVDNRDLTAPVTEQASLAHCFMDPHANCVISFLFPLVLPRGSNMCTPPGLELLFFLHLFFCFQEFTLCCSIVTVFLLPYLKWQTCGKSYHWSEMA